MKKFCTFLVLLILVVFSTNAYSQKYAATQLITNDNGVSFKMKYLDELPSNKNSNTITENVEVIWSMSEEYAIGEHVYYSKDTEKSFVNWSLNDNRVAQYGNTNSAIWEFPTTYDFTKSFSNKDGSLYIVADGTEIYVLDPEDGGVLWQKTVSDGVSFAAAYPDGSGFYYADGSNKVYSHLVDSQTPTWTLEAEASVVGINVSEDHSQVVVCLAQPGTKALIVNPVNGNVTQELYYYNNSPTQTPAFSANGEYLALADFSGKGTLYKKVDGVYEQQWQASLQHSSSSSTWGCGIAISADGSTIAFGTLGFTSTGYMGSLFVFNNYSGVPLWSFHDFGDEVDCISITDDGSLIACATYGPMDHSAPDLYVFRKESSVPLATLGTSGSLSSVNIASDGSRGVAAGKGVHAREMGWGGNAYFFKPVPSSYGNISGVANLIGADDNSYVLLTLEGIDDYYAYSNYAGDFDVKYIPAGTYSLTATKQGYYSQTIENIEITGGATTEVNIDLEAAGQAVKNLFATQGADKSVILTWNEYEAKNIGYNIYRKLNPDAPFTEIYATIGPEDAGFSDDNALPTIDYYYAVTAIISSDLESPFSNTVLGYASTIFITKEIDIYETSLIPSIDGVISDGEWDDAFMFDASDFLGSDGTYQPVGSVFIYMKMLGGDLYVAVENYNDNQLSSGDRTAFYIDDNFNGVYEESGDESEGNYWINYGPGGNYSVQYRPIYNTGGTGTTYTLTCDVAASDATGHVVAEFVLPIGPNDHDITPGNTGKSKAYIYVRDGAFGNQDGQWPFDNPETFVPTGYGIMNFNAIDEVPPAPENLTYISGYS
ncbi:carboxypeptidase regulatory-like domain-containing protein, partial [Bacteroidales bacterium OttesenSCG-928-L14]|nr:carboxypeptidase regulatory-like domain-containing protein [Bacteroidales bacterium OttesenSCG-928-L14]